MAFSKYVEIYPTNLDTEESVVGGSPVLTPITIGGAFVKHGQFRCPGARLAKVMFTKTAPAGTHNTKLDFYVAYSEDSTEPTEKDNPELIGCQGYGVGEYEYIIAGPPSGVAAVYRSVTFVPSHKSAVAIVPLIGGDPSVAVSIWVRWEFALSEGDVGVKIALSSDPSDVPQSVSQWTVSDENPDVVYGYDGANNLVSIVKSAGGVIYSKTLAYDGANNLISNGHWIRL